MKLNYGIVTRGWLRSVDLSYDVYPQKITESKIVYRDKVILDKPKFNAYIALATGINNHQLQGSLLATYKGVGGQYTYDLTHSTHLAGVVIKIK